MLPALSYEGVLLTHVIPGSVNGELFEGFIEELLDLMNPFPEPNSVLVMDNATIHKSDELQEMVLERCVDIYNFITINSK